MKLENISVEKLSELQCLHTQFYNAINMAYIHSAFIRELDLGMKELNAVIRKHFEDVLRKFDEDTMCSAVSLNLGGGHYLAIYRDGASSGIMLRKKDAEKWIKCRDKTSKAFFRKTLRIYHEMSDEKRSNLFKNKF